MKIGTLELKHGLFLAPMAGVTDFPFRKLCKRYGAEYLVTEMISAKAIHFDDYKTSVLAKIRAEESPCAIQIFGSEPDIMAEAAKLLSEGYLRKSDKNEKNEALPAAIDINMGCPVRKITANNEGSALMKNPKLVYDIVSAVVSAVNVPVTVKIRAGWDSESINAVEIATIAEEAGAAAICVHGRTKDQLYMPPVNLDIIKEVKKAVSVPVIGNGGIECADDAIKMFEETGCDGIMVARGALGNPFIFEEITARLEGKPYTKPTIEKRLRTALEHINLLILDKGEYVGVREARKHLSWYIHGITGAAELRNRINHIESADELRSLIYDVIEKNKGY